MKKFKCVAKATAQGTEAYWKVEAEDETDALVIFEDTAVQHIESFDNSEEIEEESGFEYEYNYFVTEITDKEYEELDVDNLI